jgi:plastocyanin
MKKPVVIIIAAIIIVLGGAGLYVSAHKTTKPATANTGTTENTSGNNTPTASTTDTTTAASTITYSNNGFSPDTITVKSGTSVTVKNTSSQAMQFDSDPHPAHTNDTDLNVGLVAAGKTTTFVADKTGSFGFHNHLNPSDTGKIIVQ